LWDYKVIYETKYQNDQAILHNHIAPKSDPRNMTNIEKPLGSWVTWVTCANGVCGGGGIKKNPDIHSARHYKNVVTMFSTNEKELKHDVFFFCIQG
jgi:hypothetical protein